jgi:hypothetical protein
LRRMLFLVLQKDGREEFVGIQLHLTLPSDSDTELAVPHWRFDWIEWGTRRWLCSVPVVSLQTIIEKSGYDVWNITDCRINFVLVWRKILFVSLIKDKHCFVLSLHPL